MEAFVDAERARGAVYPSEPDVFAALAHTPLDRVKVVLLGQDPYHGEGQAHGLAFSVRPGVAPPPSLANLMKELERDVGCARVDHGCLEAWADRGVLLLNTVLTVRAGEPGSHAKKGWEKLTDAVIRVVDARPRPAVFLLLGAPARKKAALVDRARHRVIEGVHPSPLSASQGFFGSKPFSAVNRALTEMAEEPIDWQLSNLGVPIAKRTRTR
jgi:uracil-DNA glycosylase